AVVAPIGMKAAGENAAPALRLGLLCLEHDRAGAIAEEHTGAAIFPIEDAAHRLGPDHQCRTRRAAAQHIVRYRNGIEEARADRRYVKGDAAMDAERRLH